MVHIYGKYKLGVSHLLFSFDKKYSINMLLDWYIPIPDTRTSVTIKDSIVGDYTINSLNKSGKGCLMKDSLG